MAKELLITFITMIVNGLEDFFSVLVYPTRKYIKVALFIAIGFLVFSLVSLALGIVVFVDYYEAITCIVMLGGIYFASAISSAQVSNMTKYMQTKTTEVMTKAKNITKTKTKTKSKNVKGVSHGKHK